jgi:type I restriction enzyme, R subunit
VSGHTEQAFESAIEHGLITRDRYQKRTPDAFDPATALFPDDAIGFIRDSQPTRWAQLEAMLKDQTAATVIDSLTKELASKGTLGVLRHGFKCYGKERASPISSPTAA